MYVSGYAHTSVSTYKSKVVGETDYVSSYYKSPRISGLLLDVKRKI